MKRQPVQSMWFYTLDVGLAIKASNSDKIKKWTDLTGKKVFTGPLPFDTRLHLETAMAAVGAKHVYTQVDLSNAGSQLNAGTIDAIIVYYTGGVVPAPVAHGSLAVGGLGRTQSLARKNSPAQVEERSPSRTSMPQDISKKDIHVQALTLLPFYWGFDIGMNMSADDVYKMLTIVDKNADNLAKLDGDFAQISGGKLAEFQTKALEQTVGSHPDSPRPCQIPEGKRQVESEVGLQSRRDVIAYRYVET